MEGHTYCHDNWDYDPVSKTCYLFVQDEEPTLADYNKAKSVCNMYYDSSLLSFDGNSSTIVSNYAKQNFIISRMITYGISKGWMGLQKTTSNYKWDNSGAWYDWKPVADLNSAPNATGPPVTPKYADGHQDCASGTCCYALDSSPPTSDTWDPQQWILTSCNTQLGYICQGIPIRWGSTIVNPRLATDLFVEPSTTTMANTDAQGNTEAGTTKSILGGGGGADDNGIKSTISGITQSEFTIDTAQPTTMEEGDNYAEKFGMSKKKLSEYLYGGVLTLFCAMCAISFAVKKALMTKRPKPWEVFERNVDVWRDK